jgi:hypothetical protein
LVKAGFAGYGMEDQGYGFQPGTSAANVKIVKGRVISPEFPFLIFVSKVFDFIVFLHDSIFSLFFIHVPGCDHLNRLFLVVKTMVKRRPPSVFPKAARRSSTQAQGS